jgi:beta-phosphoglucomutase-like phosphatase (HAD superfamily)
MKLKIPDGTFDAYLFDGDGTIADSMPLHYVAWRSALTECNVIFQKSSSTHGAVSRWPT